MAMEHVHTNCLFNGAAWGSFFNIRSFPFSFCRNRGMLNSQWAVYRCFVRLLYSTCIPFGCFNGSVPMRFTLSLLPWMLIFRDGTDKKECRGAMLSPAVFYCCSLSSVRKFVPPATECTKCKMAEMCVLVR